MPSMRAALGQPSVFQGGLAAPPGLGYIEQQGSSGFLAFSFALTAPNSHGPPGLSSPPILTLRI